MPEKVKEYKKGKKGLMGMFVGEVKKKVTEKPTCSWLISCF